MTVLKAVQRVGSENTTVEAGHGVAEGGEGAADLAVTTLVHGDLV